jgi:hypothetical protein
MVALLLGSMSCATTVINKYNRNMFNRTSAMKIYVGHTVKNPLCKFAEKTAAPLEFFA